MECKVRECLHCEYNKCTCNSNGRSDPSKDVDCINFEYNCVECMEMGFRYFECSDCCLSEDEYYEDED